MCLLLILSNKLDLNQETRFTILVYSTGFRITLPALNLKVKVYTKDIKRQAKRSLAWVSETDSILIKGKRERFLKRQTGCLKRFDG